MKKKLTLLLLLTMLMLSACSSNPDALVKITVPADFVGETTQEDLDNIASTNGYKSITLQSDGSAIYTMTKQQHTEMMDEMASNINNSLDGLIGAEDFPNFTEIKANETFTEFTITTKSIELDTLESFSVIAFFMYGEMYNAFNGTPVENITATFVNADSGEVISTLNSSDM